ncbi:MAG: DUF3108 domain-containing protein, partial [Nitrospinales bacterium]
WNPLTLIRHYLLRILPSGKSVYLVVALSLILQGTPLSSLAEPEQVSPEKKEVLGKYDSFLPRGDIRRFVGETLYFDISFLWFDQAAVASMSFFERDGQFHSLLTAETKGFIGALTSYRKHVYKATFDIVDNGNRVRTTEFERLVTIGDIQEKTLHHMDYNTRVHSWIAYRNDEVIELEKQDIPEGIILDDILAAFYNMRNSVYGDLKKGHTYQIYTLPEKGHDRIFVEILNEAKEEQYRIEAGREKADEFLIDVIVPKEIFKTKEGKLRFWTSKHYLPLSTTVKDYFMFGDLHAQFVKREFAPQKDWRDTIIGKSTTHP